ncbi:N-acetyltransferase [Xanthomonas citri pv. fuscans CFBP 6996]|uniref:GNAT family N-acetyltransferase n=1 Tax=Xanthomonas citri TaxID=346 RepID=UPI000B5CC9CD|nr:GNAT family N-acetyltransferase [Xanthomonas citri]ASK99974.1 GNAT family N-acetyltransferase [Xanthomonas citri pv. vignicola]ATS50809.1 GNAT family N-acetyltransferase [Xanthomonas citri pv. phaseoli var. fuscans]ATS56559.1 GNAT family N-acetyltransferase [Xanthomonas citri pv. phaseoli var. fuscans]ATS59434.1 GNAT family N-acetyltransferase [Xanthomonas citri pv. phaseoli var. fuscans]PTY31494.1 N-acetyltransferase [Xanthomonas citri pv. fuscans CFBP 6996]
MRDSIPVRYNNAPPMADDYCQLRLLAGMSPKAKQTAEASLPNTVFGVSGYQCGELVAMGRIIGDSGCHLQLCDIAVHPRLQRQGMGKEVMRRLNHWMEHNLLPTAEVSLLARGSSHLLYAQYGFAPTAPASISMCRRR